MTKEEYEAGKQVLCTTALKAEAGWRAARKSMAAAWADVAEYEEKFGPKPAFSIATKHMRLTGVPGGEAFGSTPAKKLSWWRRLFTRRTRS